MAQAELQATHVVVEKPSECKQDLAWQEFTDYEKTVPEVLDAVHASEVLRRFKRIVIKPNLVQASPFPITTPPDCVAAILEYCRMHTTADLFIAEGSGGCDTFEAYHTLGYMELSRSYRVSLVDLDKEDVLHLKNHNCRFLKEFYLPRILQDCFLVSVPVLKAHSMSMVTLTLKNMIGIAPAQKYKASAFRKSRLHGRNNTELHRYIIELNQYRKPDLTILDATVGMAQAHLWGPPCNPSVNKLVAGFDPVAVDAFGAYLLGIDWRKVDHIAGADGILGHVPQFLNDVGKRS